MLIHTLLLQSIFNLHVNALVNWINWKPIKQNVLLPFVNLLNCLIKRILTLYVARISTLMTWFIWSPIKQNVLLPSLNEREYENFLLFVMLNVTLARKEQIQNYYDIWFLWNLVCLGSYSSSSKTIYLLVILLCSINKIKNIFLQISHSL